MASQTDCPFCGSPGILATHQLLDLYRCTNRKCRQEFWVEHQLCQHPSCADWVDDDESGYCWYHASHHGIRLPETWRPYNPDDDD